MARQFSTRSTMPTDELAARQLYGVRRKSRFSCFSSWSISRITCKTSWSCKTRTRHGALVQFRSRLRAIPAPTCRRSSPFLKMIPHGPRLVCSVKLKGSSADCAGEKCQAPTATVRQR